MRNYLLWKNSFYGSCRSEAVAQRCCAIWYSENLRLSLFSIKLQAIRREHLFYMKYIRAISSSRAHTDTHTHTHTQFCEISKEHLFYRKPLVAASISIYSHILVSSYGRYCFYSLLFWKYFFRFTSDMCIIIDLFLYYKHGKGNAQFLFLCKPQIGL